VITLALMFANGWFTACDGFYDASACWLSHMKQQTINHNCVNTANISHVFSAV